MKSKTNKKKDELTVREQFIKYFCGLDIVYTQDGKARERTPSEFRSTLARQKSTKRSSWSSDEIKYELAKKAFQQLMGALESPQYYSHEYHDGKGLSNALHALDDAQKFQGYIQMRIVYAEWWADKLSESEMIKEITKAKLSKYVGEEK